MSTGNKALVATSSVEGCTSKTASKTAEMTSKGKGKPKEDVKNRGWPKGKKRYPKYPGSPKQPLSGYVHFLNDRRESVRKENPDMSFADISKKLANEWSQAGDKAKQHYAARAEADKERYAKEFADFQKTKEYKEFIEKEKTVDAGLNSKKANLKQSDTPLIKKQKKTPEKRGKPPPKNVNKSKSSNFTQMNSQNVNQEIICKNSQPLTSGQTIDIPIFSEEFLEHNKARDAELRQLRKQATEFEEQNAILQKHVENMRSAMTKVEQEILQQEEGNASLERHLQSLRRLVVAHFAGTHLSPHFKEPLTLENVDAYVRELRVIVEENSMENEALVTKAKDIASRMTYDTFAA